MSVAVERLDIPTVRQTVGEEGYAPLLRCEVCGGEIPKPASGRVAWRAEENTTYLSPTFLHEGCVDAFREQAGGRVEAHAKRVGGSLRVGSLEDFLDGLRRFL